MSAASTGGVIALLVTQVAVFLALILLASGLHKVMRRARIESVVREFAGVSGVFAPFVAMAAAAAELLAGLMLLMPGCRALGGILAASIWAMYLCFILRAIAQGRRDVDCGCTFGAAHRPLGPFQVTRNAVLVGTAALVAAGAAMSGGAAPSGGAVVGAAVIVGSEILAALALAALYGAIEHVMALTPPRGGVLL
jgi:hypothetical protein